MTTITIDRAVVEQVLEALETVEVDSHSSDAVRKANDALLAALAQEQAEPVQEPTTCRARRRNRFSGKWSEWLYDLPLDFADIVKRESVVDEWEVQELYTAPPRRTMVPLTEEEIDNICRQAHGGADPQEWSRNFACAVEKASWEKNK